jgi:hypothetical protein
MPSSQKGVNPTGLVADGHSVSRVLLAAIVAALVLVAPVFGRASTEPPNPRFTACRTASKLIVDYRFETFSAGRDRRPWMLVISAKSAGTRYVPLTYRTIVKKRVGRIVQSLGLGGPPWRVLLSVVAPSGRRSPTIDRPLSPCR